MTTEQTTLAKRGRKPIGEMSMSAAERMRRSRERKQATGAKVFQMQLEGMHLEYVELLAESNNVSASAALRSLLEPLLHRYVGMVRRCEQLKENGATDEEVVAFMRTYYMPDLPPMPDKKGQ